MGERKEAVLAGLLQKKGYIRGPFGSALKRPEMKSEGIPVYEQQHAIYNSREFRFYIDEEKFEELKRFQVATDDLVISCSGTVGKVTIIREDDPKGIISQALLILRADSSKVLPEYLKYFFSSQKGYNAIVSRSSGSVQVNISKREVIEQIPLSLPSIDEQKKIVGVLKTIDDKIATNEKINRNLSEQVQALYKSWFVDYEPFDGVTPEEWSTGVLKDVLKLRKDGMKAGENTELPYLPIDVIPMNDLAIHDIKPNEEAKSSLITFNKNDILIGAMRVYFHRVVIAPFDGITRSTCFVLRPYDEEYLGFGLLCCNQNSSIEYAQSTSKGSTMPYAVWENGLGDMDIIIPDKKTATLFNEIVKPMLEIIQQSFYENQRLQGLRDSLLPRLMSGELDVSDLEI